MRPILPLLVLSLAACEKMSPPLDPTGPSLPPPVVSEKPAPELPAPPPPRPPVDSNPTVLTEEQLARDRALAGPAAALVDAYANWAGPFSSLVATAAKDNKRFLYGSQRDGVVEIYLGDASRPADAPKAITRGPERGIW